MLENILDIRALAISSGKAGTRYPNHTNNYKICIHGEIKNAVKEVGLMMSGVSFAPYVPSQPEVVRKMLEVARVGPEDVVYDLGCGDGRILVMAVKRFGVKKAVGYELREDLYKLTLRKIERQNLKERISLMNGDLFQADISDATVITLYLSASGNEHLKIKLTKEARPGARVISYDFKMNGWQASVSEITAYIGYIYMYVIPDAFSSPNEKKSMAST